MRKFSNQSQLVSCEKEKESSKTDNGHLGENVFYEVRPLHQSATMNAD